MGNFNSLVFAKPETSSYDKYHSNLFYVPDGKEPAIPCMFLECFPPSDRVMLYFHGNAVDIGIAAKFMRSMVDGLGVNVLLVEYPSYGIYTEARVGERAIKKNALRIFDFLTLEVGVDCGQILVFGRSLGSGPACYLANNREVSGLVLFTPFMSIGRVAKSKVCFLGNAVKSRF